VSDHTPPETPAEALAEARLHALRAVAELAVSLRALVDAAALAADGEIASEGRLAPVAEALEAAARWLDPEREESGDAAAVLRALAEGLETEIERWEARSREDSEARSVLRAFLAVREVLWEMENRFGRPQEPEAEEAPPEVPGARGKRSKRRVQRVAVEG
jgi:hypothetical protein